LLVEALTSTSPRLQATAVAELTSIEGAGFGKRINELPPRAQVQAITALADTGKQDILPVLEQHLTSGADSVRVASLRGIGKLGSAKHISVLATRAASATGDEQAAARAALGAIRGKEADSAVLTAITTTDPKVKIELIRAAGERGISTAPDILLKTASHENRAVRLESIRALRETAGSADISALVSLLVKTANETDRKEYERTVAAAIRRSKDAPISELVAAYKTATDTDLQVSLLGVMGTVGSSEALPIIRQALTSSNADVQRAAINTLASWPSPEPAKDLLTLAQSAPNAVHQILGLRGYVRLVQLPSDRAPAETAKMLSAGMAAAKRPEEKKIVIAAAQRVITPESVDLVKATLDDPAVAPEAKAAITTLERGLMYRKN
jgi:HEAT repeat protein